MRNGQCLFITFSLPLCMGQLLLLLLLLLRCTVLNVKEYAKFWLVLCWSCTKAAKASKTLLKPCLLHVLDEARLPSGQRWCCYWFGLFGVHPCVALHCGCVAFALGLCYRYGCRLSAGCGARYPASSCLVVIVSSGYVLLTYV